MILGEKMSGVVPNPENVITGIDGSLYETLEQMRMGRPMHLGPSLYVHLWKAATLRGFDSFEVYQDHAAMRFHVVVTLDGREREKTFDEVYFFERQITVESAIEQFVKWAMDVP